MKTVTVPERSFVEAFRQAEFDLNKAVHDADALADATERARIAVALANVQRALTRLRDRLIES